MKLATTTSDYFAYSLSHTDILRHIRKAGFRYADYNFGRDYNQRDGVYSENIELYLYTVANAAEKDGIKLIANGKTFARRGRQFSGGYDALH